MIIDLQHGPKANSLLERLTYLLFPIKLVGLFPFTKTENFNKSQQYLRLVIILFVAVSGAFIIVSDSIKLLEIKSSITTLIKIIFFLVCWLSATVTWIQSIITTKKQIKMLSLIDDIDMIFHNNLYQAIDYDAEKRQLKRKICLYLIVVLSGSVGLICSIWSSNTFKSIALTGLLFATVPRFTFLLLILLIELISHRLNIMLFFMKKLPLHYSSSYELNLTIKMVNIQLLTIQSKSLISKLHSLRAIYTNIWKITIMLSESFGWSIVVAMIYFFINVTFQAYFLILNLTSKEQLVYKAWIGNLCLKNSI